MAIAENIHHQPLAGSAKSSAFASEASHLMEWQLVRRIVASPAFTRSPLLTNFLFYVCDRKLQGRDDEITEHQIGVRALGRPENYHPGEDNIVRNYARILRKRLEEFFEEEGRHEVMRIVIPRGQYVPIFEPAATIEEPPLQSNPAVGVVREEVHSVPAVEAEVPARQGLNRRKFVISATAAAAALAGAGWFELHHNRESQPEHLFRAFWAQIFSPNRESFIVTGDSGLVLLERMTGQTFPLNSYVNGKATSAFRDLTATSQSAKDTFGKGPLPHYTSTADLRIAVALDRIAESVHATPKIRNARDLRMDEIKRSNCVLIGGPNANPWSELFDSHSNFQMRFYLGDNPTPLVGKPILNKRPKQGEPQEYLNSPTGTVPFSTYTIVSFLPSVDNEGWALLLQGQILSGTEAAGDFVTNVNVVAPVLQKARQSDGTIGPFQLVLETQAVGADAPQARIVGERYQLFKP